MCLVVSVSLVDYVSRVDSVLLAIFHCLCFSMRPMSLSSLHLSVCVSHCCFREMTIMGDSVTIAGTKEGVKFSAKGDLGSGSIVCQEGVEDEEDKNYVPVKVKLEDLFTQSFSLKYLNNFCKASPLSSTVTLKMSPDVPLVVEYLIEGAGYIRFYLAPKIGDQEEETPE